MKTATEYWQQARQETSDSKYSIALKTIQKAIEIEPENARFISERGVILFWLDRKNEALRDLDTAVRLEPNNAYRYSSRAYIKAAMKMYSEAIQDYEKCIELNPDDAIAYNNLGLLHESAGRIKSATKQFDKANELENILKERRIDSDIENSKKQMAIEEAQIKNTEPQINTVSDALDINENTWSITKKVFQKGGLFKDYIKFVKRGFKLDNDD